MGSPSGGLIVRSDTVQWAEDDSKSQAKSANPFKPRRLYQPFLPAAASLRGLGLEQSTFRPRC